MNNLISISWKTIPSSPQKAGESWLDKPFLLLFVLFKQIVILRKVKRHKKDKFSTNLRNGRTFFYSKSKWNYEEHKQNQGKKKQYLDFFISNILINI